jgi:hypothetical protein
MEIVQQAMVAAVADKMVGGVYMGPGLLVLLMVQQEITLPDTVMGVVADIVVKVDTAAAVTVVVVISN